MRSPFPTAPVGSRGKRRQTAGRKSAHPLLLCLFSSSLFLSFRLLLLSLLLPLPLSPSLSLSSLAVGVRGSWSLIRQPAACERGELTDSRDSQAWSLSLSLRVSLSLPLSLSRSLPLCLSLSLPLSLSPSLPLLCPSLDPCLTCHTPRGARQPRSAARHASQACQPGVKANSKNNHNKQIAKDKSKKDNKHSVYNHKTKQHTLTSAC